MRLANLALTTIFFVASSAFAATKTDTIYSIPVKTIKGESTTLQPYAGKVLLIVNTASQCGFTPQYKSLQATFDKYSAQGLVVLGFPSNDFGAQEPGSDAEIKNFCERNFKVSFPMFSKGSVNGGKDAATGKDKNQPLYQYLLANAPTSGPVKWNFEKFLIDRKGKIVARFPSKVTPDSPELTSQIEKLLAEK